MANPAYATPKTNWSTADGVAAVDMIRIEGNTLGVAAYEEAQISLSGGGTITWDGSGLAWSTRFIALSIDYSQASAGYIDFTMPSNGTVIAGYGTTPSTTVAAGKIPLPTGTALFGQHTPGGNASAVTYKVGLSANLSNGVIPPNAILLALRNPDVAVLKLGTGQVLAANNTIVNGVPTYATQASSDSSTNVATTAFGQGAFVNKATPVLGGEMDAGAHTIGFTETDNGNSGAAKTIDWKLSNKQKIAISANTTLTFTAPTKPCSMTLKMTYSGSFTVTLPTHKKQGGVALTFSSVNTAVDILSIYWDGTSYFIMNSLAWS